MSTIVLPKDVKDKIEAAKKLEAEVFKTDVTAPTEPVEPTTAPVVAPVEPPVEPVAPAPEATPAPELPAETISKAEFDKLSHRFDVVQGMHRADTKKLRETIDQLLERNEKLLAELQEARLGNVTAPTVTRETEPQAPTLGESAKMIQEKYPDLFNAITEIVSTNSPKAETDKGELAEQVNFIMNDLATKSQREFYSFLDSNSNGWREVNDSPEFVGWLQTTDSFSGHTFHELLLDAYNRMDAPRVKAFFDRYAKESAVTAPAPTAPAPTAPVAPARPTKESLVTPAPTAVTPAPSGGEGKPTYTAKQINDHYRNRATGKLKLSAADAKKWDDEFFNAGKENRIVG